MHSHLADNLTLSLGGSTSLVVADATHEHYSGLDAYAIPDGDIDATGFTPTSGTTIYEMLLDKDDVNYISGGNDSVEVSLTNMADPGISTGHRVSFRGWSTNGWSAVVLMQGATTIASKANAGDFATSPTDYYFDLTPAEADAITDYNDLRIRLSGLIGTTYYSWVEFSVSIGLELTTQLALSIAESAHAHMADGIALTSQHVLAVADALHAHLADNLTLSTGAVANLSVFDGLHAHAADNLVLTSQHALAIAEALHAHMADNQVLSADSLLAIADAAHAHLADNVVLTSASVLAILEVMHAHYADNVVLNFDAIVEILNMIAKEARFSQAPGKSGKFSRAPSKTVEF